MDLPLGRRRLLSIAPATAGATVLPSVAFAPAARSAMPPQVTLPERGTYDSAAASDWTDGFLVGNGEYGAILYGTPALERVIFNHHRFVLPNGTRSWTPPVLYERFNGVPNKALAGDYSGACTDFIPGMATASNYVRITDFRTGEVTSTWTDSFGTWTRRAFASRADRVIVHELTPAPGRTIDATLSIRSALPDAPGSVGFTSVAPLSGASGYLKGAFGYEGVTRVVPSGGSASANGSTIVVTAAISLVLLTKLAGRSPCRTRAGRYQPGRAHHRTVNASCGQVCSAASERNNR